MKHPDKFIVKDIIQVPDIVLDNQEVADILSHLRYDVLADILEKLMMNLDLAGLADQKKNRKLLANCLHSAATNLESVVENIDQAWNICKPHMDKDE